MKIASALRTSIAMVSITLSPIVGASDDTSEQMFAVPCLEASPETIDWASPSIPVLEGKEIAVFQATPEAVYNNHTYIAHFDGKFWVMWSMHPSDGNEHGMRVRYATSADGTTWSSDAPITPVPVGKRYVARGFWVRNGELLALASFDSGRPPLSKQTGNWAAADLELQAFRWVKDRNHWEFAGIVFDDTISNYPPRLLPSGEWLLDRRDHRFALSFLIGGRDRIDHWTAFSVPNPEERDFNEPDFLIRPNGEIAAHIRDNSRSKRIYRSVSRDNGKTWTAPAQTNFPDATSKNFNLRLSNGHYILLSNPSPKGRIPLTMAVSPDGVSYRRIGIVAGAPGKPRIAGHDKGPGYTYPHALEHNGAVYVVFSRHRDDIVVKRIPLAAIESLRSPCASAAKEKGN